ncbi:MAG: 2Fe-2S iron-sulfur cluster-binding protein [Candidatus Scalindua sp.]|nr:2Fe-2S iron-sulfur cluster-binding protein [Candidatus Scalindua sp.]
MSEKVKITLNGKEIDVPRDATIREAAKSQGIEIPTFCFDDRLKAYTSCFLCVVEVEGEEHDTRLQYGCESGHGNQD